MAARDGAAGHPPRKGTVVLCDMAGLHAMVLWDHTHQLGQGAKLRAMGRRGSGKEESPLVFEWSDEPLTRSPGLNATCATSTSSK